MSHDSQYRTTDLGEAAALICVGHKLIGMEQAGTGKKGQLAFIFPCADGIEDNAKQYYLHELLVDPNQFYYHSKDLRLQVRQTGRQLIPTRST